MQVLLFMIFLHIVDDYYLQGLLANLKQKSWWRVLSNYSEKYKYDYIVALAMHSFSWTFCIMLPIMFINQFQMDRALLFVFLLNAMIHGVTDDFKANRFKINLIQDQTIHILQIVFTFLIFV